MMRYETSVILFLTFVICTLVEAQMFVCQKDVLYKENDCNDCRCDELNGLTCTRRGCSGPDYDALRRCEIGVMTRSGCNTCWCVQPWGTMCTNYKC